MVQTLERPAVHLAPTHASAARDFVLHFLEMCAAMCLAWMLITLPFLGGARLAGTDDPIRQWPEATTLLALLAMSAGMAAEMRWRGHSGRCVGEMTTAMALEAVVVLLLAATGVIPRGDQFAWFHGLMPVAMVAAMLLRLEVYTSPLHKHR